MLKKLYNLHDWLDNLNEPNQNNNFISSYYTLF